MNLVDVINEVPAPAGGVSAADSIRCPAGGVGLADSIRTALTGPFVWRTVMPRQGGPELAESLPSQAQRGATARQVAVLRVAWQEGLSTRQGAADAGVSQSTASRYYRQFGEG